MAIMEAEVVVAKVETISDPTVTGEATIKAIIITNTINITHMMTDHEKIYETNLQVTTEQTDDTLYPQINNDIEYGLFENVIDSYYLDSQIRDDFTCTKASYTHDTVMA